MTILRTAVLVLVACMLSAGDSIYDAVTQGALRVKRADGAIVECPLRHSEYRVEISGLVAQVELVQTFVNPFPDPVEAVYVFPLSHESGVNAMSLEVGGRRIVGALLKRVDARKAYEAAQRAGKTAALLDQERPNIFSQRVGNIPPAGEVRIRIGYVERIAFDRGAYEFHLPLVVGPRFIPGTAVSGVMAQDTSLTGATVPVAVAPAVGTPSGTGWSPDTDRVGDASRITPPVLQPGMRNGHDVAISVRLEAGMAIRDLVSSSHQVTVERPQPDLAQIALRPEDAIPNKDFVLRYTVAGATPELSVVSHVADDGGYLLLTLQPAQLAVALQERKPRDLCFLIDVSGSMSGQPLDKVREAMRELLALAGPQDRIQVVSFASKTANLFPDFVPVTPVNVKTALAFNQQMQSGGGTNMLEGVRAVLNEPLQGERMRMAIMLTDGFIGNEKEIIAEVGTKGNDRIRFWCIGIGSSPNRYLIDGVAAAGGGMGVVLGLHDNSRSIADELMQRIQHAQIDHLSLDWGGLSVTDVVPTRLPPLWSGRPVVVCARFAGAGSGTVVMHGEVDGRKIDIPLRLELPAKASFNRAVRTLWARTKLSELRQQETTGAGYDQEAVMTGLSLTYSVMTEYTSFVAVDERVINPGGVNRQINVAVPLPEGVTTAALPMLSSEQVQAMGCEEAIADSEIDGAFMAIGVGGGSVGMYGSRSGGGRKRAVLKGGGSVASESAFDAALRFLKKHQAADGRWDPLSYQENCTETPKCEAGVGGADDTIVLTAQATLVFLGAGYDHVTPNRYKAVVAKALSWIQTQQKPDGSFGTTVEATACATQALAEVFGLTSDSALLVPTQHAVNRLLAMRLPGGDHQPLAWGTPAGFQTADTTRAVMALKSAFAAGLSVGDGLERATSWLELAWRAANPGWAKPEHLNSSEFPAQWSTSSGASGSEVEAGAVCAVLLGRKGGDPLLDSLAATIAALKPEVRQNDLRRLQLSSLALFQLGGDAWKAWNISTRDLLTTSQHKGDGCLDASWDPQTQVGLGCQRGRLASTLHAAFILEIYYASAAVGAGPPAPVAQPPGGVSR